MRLNFNKTYEKSSVESSKTVRKFFKKPKKAFYKPRKLSKSQKSFYRQKALKKSKKLSKAKSFQQGFKNIPNPKKSF